MNCGDMSKQADALGKRSSCDLAKRGVVGCLYSWKHLKLAYELSFLLSFFYFSSIS